MRNPRLIIALLAIIIFSSLKLTFAARQNQEINTSRGKVIIGLDREKAYQVYGAPDAKGEDLWYYAGPNGFFVSFNNTPKLILYPDFFQANLGVPLEFKVFLSLPDSEVRDITKEAQLIFDRPECARLLSPGVIMPKKPGEYSALAMYKDVFSNPLYMQIKESESGEKNEKEKLLNIDILPYRPEITFESSINFVALGTFFDYDLNKYSVRDISQDAAWYIRQRPNLTWNKEDSRQLYFLEIGQAEVLAKYSQVESFLQRVEVKKEGVGLGVKRLKHILVLPEVMVVMFNSSVNMRAFGTYYDNSVMELTQDVDWRIEDPDVLRLSNNSGHFFAQIEGVTEVRAFKDGIESLPAKVAVVANENAHFLDTVAIVSSGERNPPDPDLLKEIKENVEQLKKDLSFKKKELKSIEIKPGLLEIGLGEEGKFSATGIYSDGTLSDLTILGSWGSLNKSIATVSFGNVTSASVGETSVYIEFKGVRSKYANLIVGGPRLVSLLLTPQSVKIPRDSKADFKVMGNYYDHSQRDLTAQATWGVEGSKIVRVENGVLRPLGFGRSKIYAEYSHLKSNTADIEIVLTLAWLLWLLAKIILVLLLVIFISGVILYLLAQNKRRKLRALRHKPREFILGLYENGIQLITIFGLRHSVYTAPLCYAELAKEKFLVKDNDFMYLSMKFEEAEYSRHILQEADLVAALDDYNKFFKRLCDYQGRALSFYRYFLAFIHCLPIFIFSTSENNSENK